NAYQSPRPDRGQPVEAPQLGQLEHCLAVATYLLLAKHRIKHLGMQVCARDDVEGDTAQQPKFAFSIWSAVNYPQAIDLAC
ncbi:hypothetical protein, partial [Mesorhizobium sp.]|uniref:hypothetical protein n=1 Tax=Mesorhizobium sp. TaxID=1871066 RepID=UPI0025B7ACE1